MENLLNLPCVDDLVSLTVKFFFVAVSIKPRQIKIIFNVIRVHKFNFSKPHDLSR
jgi:hypothetical protein